MTLRAAVSSAANCLGWTSPLAAAVVLFSQVSTVAGQTVAEQTGAAAAPVVNVPASVGGMSLTTGNHLLDLIAWLAASGFVVKIGNEAVGFYQRILTARGESSLGKLSKCVADCNQMRKDHESTIAQAASNMSIAIASKESIIEGKDAVIVAIKQGYDDRIDATKQAYEARIDATKQGYEARIDATKKGYEDRLSVKADEVAFLREAREKDHQTLQRLTDIVHASAAKAGQNDETVRQAVVNTAEAIRRITSPLAGDVKDAKDAKDVEHADRVEHADHVEHVDAPAA